MSNYHQLRRTKGPNSLLNAELKELSRLLAGPHPYIPHRIADLQRSIEMRPGFTAVVIATRLLNRGLHETVLQRYEHQLARLFVVRDGKWAFSKEDLSLASHFDPKRRRFDPVPVLTTDYVCVFGMNEQPKLPIHRIGDLGINYCKLISLDPALTDHMLEIGSKYGGAASWLDQQWFLKVQVCAIDPSTAVDAAIAKLERMRDELSLWKASPPDPYRDLHSQVAIAGSGSVNTFDWKRRRRSYKGLPSAISSDDALTAMDQGDDLARLITCLSRAQAMFSSSSDADLVQALSRAQDILFRDYYRLTSAWRGRKDQRVNDSDFFVDVSARWLAMNAGREVLESALLEERSANSRLVRSLLNLSPDDLLERCKAALPEDAPWPNGEVRYARARVLARLDYLARFTGSESKWRWGFRKHYVRASLDLNHVRAIRNALTHDNEFVGRSYYVTLMMNLLRDVIAFRMACFTGFEKLSPRERGLIESASRALDVKPPTAVFVLAVQGMMLDSEWTLGSGTSVWLRPDRIGRMHVNGWGNWGLGRIATTVAEKLPMLEGVRRFSWSPLSEVADLHTIELI